MQPLSKVTKVTLQHSDTEVACPKLYSGRCNSGGGAVTVQVTVQEGDLTGSLAAEGPGAGGGGEELGAGRPVMAGSWIFGVTRSARGT